MKDHPLIVNLSNGHNGACSREKLLSGLELCKAQTNLRWKISIFYFQRAKNKGTDPTTQMHRLVCALIIRM